MGFRGRIKFTAEKEDGNGDVSGEDCMEIRVSDSLSLAQYMTDMAVNTLPSMIENVISELESDEDRDTPAPNGGLIPASFEEPEEKAYENEKDDESGKDAERENDTERGHDEVEDEGEEGEQEE